MMMEGDATIAGTLHSPVHEGIGVSVVLVVHATSSHLRESLRSLARQSLSAIEIIVVNDAPGNAAVDRLVRLVLSDVPASKYIVNVATQGVANSRRIGLEQAEGEFVIFADANVCLHARALEILLKLAEYHRAEIVVADVSRQVWRDGYGGEAISDTLPQREMLGGVELFDTQIMLRNRPYDLKLAWWNKLYKRSLLAGCGKALAVTDLADGLPSILPSFWAGRCVIAQVKLFHEHTQDSSLPLDPDAEPVRPSVQVKQFLELQRSLNNLGSLDRYRDASIRLFLHLHFYRSDSCNGRDQCASARVRIVRELATHDSTWRDVVHYLERKDRALHDAIIAVINRSSDGIRPDMHTNQPTMVVGDRSFVYGPDRCRRKPAVTIATVTWNILAANRKSHFEEMLGSVARQSIGRENIEHVVIDGASTDGTLEYLENMHRTGRIDGYVSEPDSGIYNAMNRASMHADGEHVLYLNSDDYIHDDALEQLLAALVAQNADYAFADAEKIDAQGHVLGISAGNIDKIYFGTPYCHQTVLCKRACFTNAFFDESYRITMWSHALKLFLLGYRHAYVPKSLACFRVGGLSSAQATADDMRRERDFIKNSMVLPRLPITREEYEYMNIKRRHGAIKGFQVDMKRVLKSLRGAKDPFALGYLSAFERLVRR